LASRSILSIHARKDIKIPEGHEVTVYTNSEYRILSLQAERKTAGPKVLRNSDILALKQGGFTDDFIILRINSSLGLYELGTTDLLKLEEAGLSQQVISAMIVARDHN
jgi:hypothetical protein